VLQFEVKAVQDTVKIREYSHEYCIKFELFYFDSNCMRLAAPPDAAGIFSAGGVGRGTGVARKVCLIVLKSAGARRQGAAAKPTIVATAVTRR
jgi:hypothetical protein